MNKDEVRVTNKGRVLQGALHLLKLVICHNQFGVESHLRGDLSMALRRPIA